MRIQLDLWTKKVNIDGKPYYTITNSKVVTNGTNVNSVKFDAGRTTGSFVQTSAKKWQEFSADGRLKFNFDETHRDEWSVYLIDNTRGGMRIQLDLWTKKVNIDGKPYYTITKGEVITNGLNVRTVNYINNGKKGSFQQNGQWTDNDVTGRKWKFEETGRDQWSVYLIDRSRGGMRVQLDLHTKKISIDGKPYYTITNATTN